MTAGEAIQELHDRCAVYTSAQTADRLLDTIGWTAEADLSTSVLLEPCVGEGAILLEAARRLLAGLGRSGRPRNLQTLLPRIIGFEFHAETARFARNSLEKLLVQAGLAPPLASELAQAWVREQDFLLQPLGHATHLAANPPYVRWSKLPGALSQQYRNILPEVSTRGDLAVAFLDRMLGWSSPTSRVVALTSDRWMYAQYGAEFRRQLVRQGWQVEVVDPRPEKAFVRRVGAYSAIVSFIRNSHERHLPETRRSRASLIHARLIAKHGTLGDAGCLVRVGPALGCGETFLVSSEEAGEIERELVRPFIPRAGTSSGTAIASTRRVVVPYDKAGIPIALEDWPGFAKWAAKHEQKLRGRSHSKNGAPWWQTIDAIGVQWSAAPKLLVPEMCREALACVDQTDAIPAHSLYAIWPGEWPVHALHSVLNAGLLQLTAVAEAPMLGQGWFRFYKRFIVRTPLPKWSSLTSQQQETLAAGDQEGFGEAFESLFGFAPGQLDAEIG